MGRFTSPRRMGSTGWMMRAASRSAWNNRGSNAAYYEDREGWGFLYVMGFIAIVPPLILLLLMYLLVNPSFGVFSLVLMGIGGLIHLGKARIRRGN